MPQLEQRRGPYPVAARVRFSLISTFSTWSTAAVRRWPLTWALFHLAGFTLGGWVSAQLPVMALPLGNLPVSLFTRLAGILPLGLNLAPRTNGTLVWLLVLGLSLAAGMQESRQRGARFSAVVDSPWGPAQRALWEGVAVVRITGWPGPGRNDSWRAPARFVHLRGSECDSTIYPPKSGEGIMLKGEGEPPAPGALLMGRLKANVPSVATVPGGFDYRCFLAGRGILWSGLITDDRRVNPGDPVALMGQKVLLPLRTWLLEQLGELLPGTEAGLAAAVLLGRRTPTSREASRPFADLGLAHLFSVSGLHVGILLGIFLLPALALSTSPTWRVLPLAVILPLYVLLTGIPGSVVRAAGLGFLGLAAVLAGRRADPVYLVGLLFWMGSIWDPMQNLDPGLRLSYLAAGGILAVGRPAQEAGILGRGWLEKITAGLLVSLTAQWFTLPQVGVSFGRISLLSPLANLVAVPLFGLAIWAIVLALALNFVFPWGGQALAAWAWLLMRSLAGAVQWSAHTSGGLGLGLAVPGPGRVVILALMTVMFLRLVVVRSGGLPVSLMFRRVGILVIFGVGFLVVAPWGADLDRVKGVTVWQLDVGQGDCSLIVFPDGWTCMVDTAGRFGRDPASDGPLSRSVLPFLSRGGINRLNAVVLTHDHLDHTGGVAALAKGIEVENYYCGGEAAHSLESVAEPESIHHPLAGKILHAWSDWTLEVLFPAGPLPKKFSENNHSLVIGLRHKDRYAMVFNGDLEQEGEALWAKNGNIPRNIQVWKAGHHGSDTSGSPELLAWLNPEMILVSCGVGNRYDHPSHGPYVVQGDTLTIQRTDLGGSIRLEWDNSGQFGLTSWNRLR